MITSQIRRDVRHVRAGPPQLTSPARALRRDALILDIGTGAWYTTWALYLTRSVALSAGRARADGCRPALGPGRRAVRRARRPPRRARRLRDAPDPGHRLRRLPVRRIVCLLPDPRAHRGVRGGGGRPPQRAGARARRRGRRPAWRCARPATSAGPSGRRLGPSWSPSIRPPPTTAVALNAISYVTYAVVAFGVPAVARVPRRRSRMRARPPLHHACDRRVGAVLGDALVRPSAVDRPPHPRAQKPGRAHRRDQLDRDRAAAARLAPTTVLLALLARRWQRPRGSASSS